jgi:hypothetical protein
VPTDLPSVTTLLVIVAVLAVLFVVVPLLVVLGVHTVFWLHDPDYRDPKKRRARFEERKAARAQEEAGEDLARATIFERALALYLENPAEHPPPRRPKPRRSRPS